MLRLLLTLFILIGSPLACVHQSGEPQSEPLPKIQTTESNTCRKPPLGSQLTSILIFSIGNGISFVTLGSPILVYDPLPDCD